MRRLLTLLTATLLIAACGKQQPQADLIVTNAVIWTGNEARPMAKAMAVRGDTLLAVGELDEVLKFKGDSTLVLDAEGHFIAPGFTDSHVHVMSGGLGLSSVKLTDAKTPREFIERIASFAKSQPAGAWILYGEWDETRWGIQPQKEWIDSVTRDNPVFVWRVDGHQALANSLALNKAGVTRTTAEVPGGTIVRGANNEPTGILKDNAMQLVYGSVDPSSDEQLDKALQSAMKYLASQGVTSIHNMWDQSDEPGTSEALERAQRNGSLITRIYDLGSLKKWQSVAQRVDAQGMGDRWLRIDGLKGFVDGSLGSQTAAFFDPFLGTTNTGLFVTPPNDLAQYIGEASNAGLHIAVHGIGDRAIDFLLNTYDSVQHEQGNLNQRFRIEHLQHIREQDIPRVSQLGVIASMQPYHAIDDGRWAAKHLDSVRLNTTYAFRSLLDNKAMLVFGSDWPVAPASPLWGIYAAVTRRTLDDKNPDGWIPEQKITTEEALRCYTVNPAYASFEEDSKGTLEVGKLADFVMLSEDITQIDPVKIKDVNVLKTFVGGVMVFDLTAAESK